MNNDLNYTVSAGKRLTLFLCITVICVLLTSVMTGIITYSEQTTVRLRIATVIQDVFMFIMPSILTAMIICRKPADFLQIDKRPTVWLSILVIFTIIAAVPALNVIIKWNASLQFPESLVNIEQWMRAAENKAAIFTQTLLGGTGIGSFIMALMIVGVLAAFSEEIFFRGTLQRLFSTSGLGVHAAVWITAFIFSAIHMQFFGFIPRLLLGAFFGYVVAWSGNLWLGVLAHFTNNALAAIAMTIAGTNSLAKAISPADTDITSSDIIFAGGSAAIVILLIVVIKRVSGSLNQTSCG
ncbi:MAG: CPBP family intramembrane metalloprotease [Paramuribaculum sp.]|nr:CPBP family intramembrane metalloprotease [Paramuribaculum sp.]